MNAPIESPRRPGLALLLSLLIPGLGQLYCGKLARALAILCIAVLLYPVLLYLLFQTDEIFGSLLWITVLATVFSLVIMADAWRLARKAPQDYQRTGINTFGVYFNFWQLSMLCNIGVAVGLSFALKQEFESFKIPRQSQSMMPTIQGGDLLIALKRPYLDSEPEVGDLIIYRSPDNRRQFWIKRVVALAGQVVEIRDGQLRIDGQALPIQSNESGVGEETNGKERYMVAGMSDSLPDMEPVTVPAHTVFTLSDNRENTIDSRQVGPIAINAIHGKASQLIWPPQRKGTLE